MKLLLDTHAFLWWDADADELPAATLKALQDPANDLILSVVSVWELQIKAALGRLTLQMPIRTLVEEQQERNNLQVLPVLLAHVLELDAIGNHHNDPFDRSLIAQARSEGLTLVSKDEVFGRYRIRLFWN